MRKKPRNVRLQLYPAGVRRAGLKLAARPDGSLELLRGRVTAEDGETRLSFSVDYALDEPFPRTLLLDGGALVEVVRPPVLPNRTRRCLLVSAAQGRPRELWIYLEPENVWAVAADPVWIAAQL